MSDFADEMAKREQLVAQKLAEVGLQLQPGSRFLRLPDGSVGLEMSGIWIDDKALQTSTETQDEFEKLMAAEQEHEAAERARKRKEDEERARRELQKLATEGELGDVDPPDPEEMFMHNFTDDLFRGEDDD